MHAGRVGGEKNASWRCWPVVGEAVDEGGGVVQAGLSSMAC
jgi:hypothetical protein